MCPRPNFAELRRDAFLVTYDEEGSYVFTRVPFSSLKESDYFVLEAPPNGVDVDPISREVAVERMFRATSDPYLSEPIDGEWLIECERV